MFFFGADVRVLFWSLRKSFVLNLMFCSAAKHQMFNFNLSYFSLVDLSQDVLQVAGTSDDVFVFQLCGWRPHGTRCVKVTPWTCQGHCYSAESASTKTRSCSGERYAAVFMHLVHSVLPFCFYLTN